MRPYPQDHSILLIDNCPIHKQQRLLDAVNSTGALVLFLTPYDPDSMPIEVGFRAMKGWMRSNQEIIEDMPMVYALRIAARAVTPAAARNAFHECGYL